MGYTMEFIMYESNFHMSAHSTHSNHGITTRQLLDVHTGSRMHVCVSAASGIDRAEGGPRVADAITWATHGNMDLED